MPHSRIAESSQTTGDLLSHAHNAIESCQQKPEHTSEHSTRIAVDTQLPLSTLKLHTLVSPKYVYH